MRPANLALPIALGACLLSSAALSESRLFPLPPFTEVEVSSGVTVTITTGQEQSVRVDSAKSDDLDKILVAVRNGKLQIGFQRGVLQALGDWLNSSRPDVSAVVSVPTLDRLDASFGANANVDAMGGSVVDIAASSGATVTIGALKGGAASISASSGGNVDVVGTCDSLRAGVSSGGNLQLGKLECAIVHIDASSGGNAAVFARDTIEANASSGGNITVAGKPHLVTVNATLGNVEIAR